MPPFCQATVRRSSTRSPLARVTGALAVAIVAAACAGQDDSINRDLTVTAPGDSGATWAAAQQAGEATVRVLYVPAPGFAYRDSAGELTGVTVEIMRDFARHVADRHGVDVTLDFVAEEDWTTFYGRVRGARGGVFGLGNVTITPERRGELAFSPPYMTNVAVLITHAIVPELESLEQIPVTFEGLRPLAFTGTLHEGRVRALRDEFLPDAPLEEAASNAEIVERVASGPDYFAYVDVYNYWRAVEAGDPLRQHPVGDQAGEEFGIIMPLATDWEAVIDEYFAADGGLRARRFYRDVLEAHLGAEVARLLLEQR